MHNDENMAEGAGMAQDTELRRATPPGTRRKRRNEPEGPMAAVARVVSGVFHPLLTPIYGALALLFANISIMVLVDPRERIYYMLGILLNCCITPALLIGLLRSTALLSRGGNSRQTRTVPLLIVTICYGLCWWMVGRASFGFIVRPVILAGCCALLAALLISVFRKISAHMLAAGAVLAIFTALTVTGWSFYPTVAGAAICGVLASARIYLERDKPVEAASGFLTGFAVTLLGLYCFFPSLT